MIPVVYHWQPPEPWTDDKPACHTAAHRVPVADALTGDRRIVTCEACKTTDVWKAGR